MKGGFDWSGKGRGRGCNQSRSWLAVDQVSYEAGSLKAIDYRFGQHCENNPDTVLLGMVHWKASPSHVGFNWQPAPDAIPAVDNYIYLDSEVGDYIGMGERNLFTPRDTLISVSSTDNVLNITVHGDSVWSGTFALPDANKKLSKGKYIDLKRYPFHNPIKGGLNWDGDGRGCNTLTGWFIIDDVSYVDGRLKSIDLRFEQHCDNNIGGLRGKVHWVDTK
ncbi:hypothetical protein ACF3NA_00525 [Alkanindiges sp. WGS2144]|uniref:hypothetical protein n=1 Tax=Alkanindiges sp. WGS2144 TaxID=3366808 RepID=UPI00375358D0